MQFVGPYLNSRVHLIGCMSSLIQSTNNTIQVSGFHLKPWNLNPLHPFTHQLNKLNVIPPVNCKELMETLTTTNDRFTILPDSPSHKLFSSALIANVKPVIDEDALLSPPLTNVGVIPEPDFVQQTSAYWGKWLTDRHGSIPHEMILRI